MRSQEAARESLEEGITQKEEVIFQLFLFKEEIVVQQSKVFEFVIKSF